MSVSVGEGVLVSVHVRICIYELRIRLFVILIYFVCEESWTFCRPRRTLSIRLAIYVYIILCVCIIGPYIAHCSQNIILLKMLSPPLLVISYLLANI